MLFELLSASVIIAKAGMRTVILEFAVFVGETGSCARQMLVGAIRRRNKRILLNFTPPSTEKNF
jgi:hypothetical protein